MNHAALSLERFPSTMGYDDPPHLVTMSVRFTVVTIDLYAHIVDGVFFFAEGFWRISTLLSGEPK